MTHTSASSSRFARWMPRIGIAVAALCVMVGAVLLIEQLAFESFGLARYDARLYWTVGRGILRGLIPYRDLFETKPPGIFLISALSFWLRGDASVGTWAQVAVLGIVPVAVSCVLLHRYPKHLVLAWCCALLSIALTLYTADRSGRFQVESFGSCFIVLYACILAWNDAPLGSKRLFAAAACLLCGIGLKEPFILTAFAVALFLRPRDAARSFFLPLFMGGVAGGIILLWTGYADPYVNIYLRHMIGEQVQSRGSPIIRGLDVPRMLGDVWDYSRPLYWSIVLAGIAQVALLWRKTDARDAITSLLLGTYLLSIAVGTGVMYFHHHFVFAVPGYIALFLALLANTARSEWRLRPLHAAALALVVACTFSLHANTPYRAVVLAERETSEQQRDAAVVDALLDACGRSQYLYVGKHVDTIYAYTQHLPLGPIFAQATLMRPIGDFAEPFLENIGRADLIIVGDHDRLEAAAEEYMDAHFSEVPWTCAEPYASRLSRYDLLYRTAEPSYSKNI